MAALDLVQGDVADCVWGNHRPALPLEQNAAPARTSHLRGQPQQPPGRHVVDDDRPFAPHPPHPFRGGAGLFWQFGISAVVDEESRERRAHFPLQKRRRRGPRATPGRHDSPRTQLDSLPRRHAGCARGDGRLQTWRGAFGFPASRGPRHPGLPRRAVPQPAQGPVHHRAVGRHLGDGRPDAFP